MKKTTLDQILRMRKNGASDTTCLRMIIELETELDVKTTAILTSAISQYVKEITTSEPTHETI